jgi:hypothetical protein
LATGAWFLAIIIVPVVVLFSLPSFAINVKKSDPSKSGFGIYTTLDMLLVSWVILFRIPNFG